MGVIDQLAKFETEYLTNEEQMKSKLFQLILAGSRPRKQHI